MFVALLLLGSLLPPPASCTEYPLGFLFNGQDTYLSSYISIVDLAVSEFNALSNITQLNYTIEIYNVSSVYDIVRASCRLLRKGVVTVITPDSSSDVGIQTQIINRVNMPLIASAATDAYLQRKSRDKLFLLSPSDIHQARVIVDLLTEFGWTKLSIIGSDSTFGIHGVTILQQLLTETTAEVTVQWEFDISVYFFSALENPEKIDLTDIMKNIINDVERVFVLHCEGRYGRHVLGRAHEAGLLRQNFVWILSEGITTAPQALRLPGDNAPYYPDYYNGLIGISVFINRDTKRYQTFRQAAISAGVEESDLSNHVSVLYDAVRFTGDALATTWRRIKPSPNSNCREPWKHGSEMSKLLKSWRYQGATGFYNFQEKNVKEATEVKYRISNFAIDKTDATKGRFTSVGYWSNSQRLKISKETIRFLGGKAEVPRGIANTLQGHHLKIGAVSSRPFAEKSPLNNCTGAPECWSGVCPDIIRKLARDLSFTYEYIEPLDGEYGTLDEGTGAWSGMVGDLLKNRIDLIGMDLSVSSQRRSYIDFTFSYIDSGISIVIKGSTATSNKYFFLSPFGLTTWTAVLIAITITSFCQSVVHKFSPYDQHGIMADASRNCKCAKCKDTAPKRGAGSQPCKVRRAQLELETDTLSLNNALWVVGGGFVGQCGEPLPRSPSGRVILLTWWFFVLLITSMYGANLTAFMTLDKQGIPLKHPQDLLEQKEYKWTLQHKSVTAVLLENNVDENFKALANQSGDVSNFRQGVESVRSGGSAHIDDTLWLEYNTSDTCNIFFIGDKILNIPVAFGLPMNSPYARLFNKQILQYREEGYFKELWSEKGRMKTDLKRWKLQEMSCPKGPQNVDSNEKTLTFSTLIGIFYFLFIGLMIGTGFLILELVFAAVQDVRGAEEENKVSLLRTFLGKLRLRLGVAFMRRKLLISS